MAEESRLWREHVHLEKCIVQDTFNRGIDRSGFDSVLLQTTSKASHELVTCTGPQAGST